MGLLKFLEAYRDDFILRCLHVRVALRSGELIERYLGCVKCGKQVTRLDPWVRPRGQHRLSVPAPYTHAVACAQVQALSSARSEIQGIRAAKPDIRRSHGHRPSVELI